MMNRKDADELRLIVARWNVQKRDAAERSMLTGIEAFTTLHNTLTREVITLMGNDGSAAWWEGLGELAMNGAALIRSGTVTGAVRILDQQDVKLRGAVNGRDVGA